VSPLDHLSLADPGRELPSGLGARMDRIRDALAALRSELGRLERLGLERPIERCRQALRFWMFLDGLHAVAVFAASPSLDLRGDRSWPHAAAR
jgi:hypothetical protein